MKLSLIPIVRNFLKIQCQLSVLEVGYIGYILSRFYAHIKCIVLMGPGQMIGFSVNDSKDLSVEQIDKKSEHYLNKTDYALSL